MAGREVKGNAVQFMQNYCEGHHYSFSGIVLMILASFLVGYISCKVNQ